MIARRARRIFCCVGGAALLLGFASQAQAAIPADLCVDANDRAQTFRREGHFAEARARLMTCADPSCPRLVRGDCDRRLDELDRAQPTVVFDVKDPSSSDVVSVLVRMDGRILADRLTGTALSIDPGEHTFSFERAGYETVTRRLVIKEGEKDRRERVVMSPPAPAVASSSQLSLQSATSTKETAEGPRSTSAGTGRLIGLLLGGAGLAAVAVGSTFGVLAIAARNAQTNDCGSPTSCPQHGQAVTEHTTFETDGAVSTVAFAAGGAFFVTGAILLLTGGKGSADRRGAWTVAPIVVGRSGSGFAFEACF